MKFSAGDKVIFNGRAAYVKGFDESTAMYVLECTGWTAYMRGIVYSVCGNIHDPDNTLDKWLTPLVREEEIVLYEEAVAKRLMGLR